MVSVAGGQVHHLPSLFIIGAQKAGTTYLRWLLVQHPALESGDGLHGETRGEPHFFDWAYPSGGLKAPAAVAAKYARMFHSPARLGRGGSNSSAEAAGGGVASEPAAEPVWFDTTPAYLVEAEVPKRVFSLLPKARLIAIVRDPTDRYRSELQVPEEPMVMVNPLLGWVRDLDSGDRMCCVG